MAKIGRNERCPCGSGKKYKHCCGKNYITRPSPDLVRQMQLEKARHEAREYARRLQQGLGRPIVSFEANGYRVVAVGKTLRWNRNWRTFPDFLSDYIKIVLTPEWGNAELKKPEAERHPLLNWYRQVCEVQQKSASGRKGPNEIFSSPITGAVRAYLGLAYDLYLCAHNAELPDLLLKRLRNKNTFEGALYETYVIGLFAKAGFKIELEDETDSSRSHCELTATHLSTGKKFSVEAKAISSASLRSGNSAASPKIRGKLYEALSKRADHERVIFIELNRTESTKFGQRPDWVKDVDAELEQAEKDLTIERDPAPPAYVFVTNRAFMHALEDEHALEIGLSCGFKINDFASPKGARSILDLVHARKRHIEMHWLRNAVITHSAIPSSFDDRLPEELDEHESIPRLLIGNTYLVPTESGEEKPGTLVEAIVLENEMKIAGIYRLENDSQILCHSPFSEKELAIYKGSPETFFGLVKAPNQEITDPLAAFDFFWNAYQNTDREHLLEFMAGWPELGRLKTVEQKDLAEIYCARLAELMWSQIMKNKMASRS